MRLLPDSPMAWLAAALLLMPSTAAPNNRAVQEPLPPEAQLPEWARKRWETVARARELALSTRINPFLQRGDFDGDGQLDLAVLVEHRRSHKVGLVMLHRAGTSAMVLGAGTVLGNGGDSFDWIDIWSVVDAPAAGKAPPRAPRRDALWLEKESSASGVVAYVNGRYRWLQRGD